MADKIFINYRRAQSLEAAQFLATHLEGRFGKRRVFIDVRGLDAFSDWFETLQAQVDGTAAMLSVIGKDWLSVLDTKEYPTGQRTGDFVRFEIATALRRNIPVLLVMLDGASVPPEDKLPLEMRGMVKLQAIDFHAKRFPEDAAKIADNLKRVLATAKRARGWPTTALVGASSGALLAGLCAGVLLRPSLWPQATDEVLIQRARDAIDARDEADAARRQAISDLQTAQRDERIARTAADAAERKANLLSNDGTLASVQLDYARCATDWSTKNSTDEITGAGASFPAPIYGKWAAEYKKVSGATLNYQSIGSGGGIKQIQAKTVTFGATDSPLKPEDLDKSGLIQFPTVIGGVVAIVNLDGVKTGDLTIDGPTLAKIFLGDIKTWNDPAIAKLNPGIKLPSTAIVTVQRLDGSDTTFIFTDYLSKISPDFKSKVGASTSVSWPGGVGAKGNEGIAAQVKQTAGSIGYADYTYLKQNNLTYMKMINAAGKIVNPEPKAFAAAANSVDWENTPGNYAILTNRSDRASWPITGATYILMYKQPADSKGSAAAIEFFRWAFACGDKLATDLDYSPMPMRYKTVFEKIIKGLD